MDNLPPAGRELDLRILCEVFGFPRKKVFYHESAGPEWPYYIPSGKPRRTHEIDARPVPHFSRDIAPAWFVFKRALETHGHAEISADMEDYGREPGDIVTVRIGLDRVVTVTGPAPEAICHAALMALAVQR